MIVVDAYGLVALLADEPAAEEVDEIIGTGEAVVTSVNLAEAVDGLERVYGVTVARVRAGVELLVGGGLGVRSCDEADAWRAAEVRGTYYDGARRPLSLADCFLIAAARPGDAVATPDPAVAEVVRSEGLRLVALPDRAGLRP